MGEKEGRDCEEKRWPQLTVLSCFLFFSCFFFLVFPLSSSAGFNSSIPVVNDVDDDVDAIFWYLFVGFICSCNCKKKGTFFSQLY